MLIDSDVLKKMIKEAYKDKMTLTETALNKIIKKAEESVNNRFDDDGK